RKPEPPRKEAAMPRLALLLLTLALLAPHTPTGVILRCAVDLLSSDSGWERDPNGPPTLAEPSPDSGWAMDPDG
ncbi:MAG: hypothetical protein ACJ76J_04780, partial [Thermoanaerobaculia bacterium]